MIPQTSPFGNYLSRQTALDDALHWVLRTGLYILGHECAAFEKQFADSIGVPYAVGVGNGAEALRFTLRALGVGSGAEVITVSNTAMATAEAVDLKSGSRFS